MPFSGPPIPSLQFQLCLQWMCGPGVAPTGLSPLHSYPRDRLSQQSLMSHIFSFLWEGWPLKGLGIFLPLSESLQCQRWRLPRAGWCGHCRPSMAGHSPLSPTWPWEGGAQAWRVSPPVHLHPHVFPGAQIPSLRKEAPCPTRRHREASFGFQETRLFAGQPQSVL